jgi:prepilin-type N-terminal cleavage/methylation domain-containing protein
MQHQQGPAMSRSSGFTLIEMVVVLILMTIIAATVLGRSISTGDMDLNSETDKIRNHLRFAQAEAMKRSDTVWGIKSAGNEYWLFRTIAPDTNDVRLPGVAYSGASNRINEGDIGVTVSDFTVFFDRIGKPYTAYTDESINTPLASQLTISVTASETRSITVTPETGLVR